MRARLHEIKPKQQSVLRGGAEENKRLHQRGEVEMHRHCISVEECLFLELKKENLEFPFPENQKKSKFVIFSYF